jgi:NAD(P)-dependent dehydrogenase (short-subunit alcohol dehydrogenase family)
MNQTILITGASSGIGKAAAKHFQAKGWNVVATMRNPGQEQELTKLDNMLVTRLDVEEPESITAAVAEALGRFGQIDVLVNNAGYGSFGVLEATSSEKIRRQFAVNVFGLLDTTKAIVPHFRTRKQGVIVNISSVGGKVGFPLGTLYHGTKFAVEGLSEALSYEMEAIGVHVKIVEPGAILTDFAGRSLDFNNDESLPEYQAVVGKMLTVFGALGSAASPAERVAEVIYQAATDGTNQLRYIAGPDAEQLITARQNSDEATFLESIRSQFGLTS